jgi:hypothetical protein
MHMQRVQRSGCAHSNTMIRHNSGTLCLDQQSSLCIAHLLLLSNADTLDSAKGWAAGIRFNERVISQFQAFYGRQDTWSLGICNGCQLMALLGWVPASGAPTDRPHGVLPDLDQPRFVHNKSGRFESRWAGQGRLWVGACGGGCNSCGASIGRTS